MKQQRGYPRVTVTPKAERGLTGGHPWVYDTEVADAQPAENGALVDVISAKGRYLGTGFTSLHSKIRVRILSRNANDVFDEAFYLRRLSHAWEYRKTVLSGEVSSCRVIFGEADLFPGLTVDRFGRYLVAQTLSVGIERIKPMLFPLLVKLLRDDGQQIDGLYERNDVAIRAREGLEENKGWFDLSALDLPRPDTCLTEIVENGVRYTVDVENGQKTVFFWTRGSTGRLWRLCAGQDGAGLLHAHRLLCTERSQGRRGPCDGGGRLRGRRGDGAPQCGYQRSVGQNGPRRQCTDLLPLFGGGGRQSMISSF